MKHFYCNHHSFHHQHQEGHLTIRGLTKADFGDYKCVAHNSHGIARDIASIIRTGNYGNFNFKYVPYFYPAYHTLFD